MKFDYKKFKLNAGIVMECMFFAICFFGLELQANTQVGVPSLFILLMLFKFTSKPFLFNKKEP